MEGRNELTPFRTFCYFEIYGRERERYISLKKTTI